ncbi:MAG TPA: hypothetical protein VD931_19130 [Baekduia sp.]|nr:hypothetical protein [Baekduia sp.]
MEAVAYAVAAVNLVAGAAGAWLWWQVEDRRWIWPLLRAGQAAAAVQAVVAGVAAATGFDPADGLYWLYALLPVAVSFVAEQLRIAAAEQVLEQRGLPDAQAVGRLDAAGQRSVVVAILRRELGVLTAAALVIAFLALRVPPTV